MDAGSSGIHKMDHQRGGEMNLNGKKSNERTVRPCSGDDQSGF